MMSLLAVAHLTLRELWARKTVLGLFLVATLVLGLVALFHVAVEPETVITEQAEEGAEVRELGPEQALVFLAAMMELVAAAATYWIGILLALFATAPLFIGFIERGRIDILLAKPAGRSTVLAGHVAAVWGIVALLAVYLLGGIWVINGLAAGSWNFTFLWSILIVLAMFAVMYAPAILVGLWTRSTAVSLIVAYGLIFLSFLTIGGEAFLDTVRASFPAMGAGLTVVYYVLPNFAEITTVVSELAWPEMAEFMPRARESVMAWTPFLSSLVFGAVVYALAALDFARRDF